MLSDKRTVGALALVALGFAAILWLIWPGKATAEGVGKSGLVPIGEVAAAATTNWTGFYVGGHGGWAKYRADATWSDTPDQGGESWLAGGQIGFNYQRPNSILVIGGEVDIAYIFDLNDNVHDGNYITQDTYINTFGTARLRLGVAVGRWLPYVTGGLAYAKLNSGENCPAGAPYGHCKYEGAYSLDADNDAFGWTAGGGFEVALDQHWSVKAEYLYANFGAQRHHLGDEASDRLADWDFHTFRTGINYKF